MSYNQGLYSSPFSYVWKWWNREVGILEKHWGENNLLPDILKNSINYKENKL